MPSRAPVTPPVAAPPRSLGGRIRRAMTRGIGRNVVALGLVSFFTDISSEMLVYVIPPSAPPCCSW